MAQYQTGPSIAYNTNHGMMLFIRDVNGYLEYAPLTGTSSGPADWKNLYGSLNGDPVAISRKGGNLDVFYIGLNEGIWHARQSSGQWGGPFFIGGHAGGQVTVAYSAASDMAQLFYKGDDQSLMTITQPGNNGTWGKPVAILPAQSVTSNIASIDVGGNRYLFFRGMDGSLKGVALTPGSTAASAPVTLTKTWAVTSNISPVQDASGITLFYRGPDSALWEVPSAAGSWAQPLSLGGRVSGDPVVTTLPGGRIRVYYRSTDGGIYFVQQSQSTASTTPSWSKHQHLLGVSANAKDSSGATLLSQTIFSNPVIGINPDGRQEAFYVGNEGAMWHMREGAASSLSQQYPAWSPQTSLGYIGLAARGNSIIAATLTGTQPIASYTALDAATIYDIINNALFFNTCLANPTPLIGFNHMLPSCDGIPIISRAMGIALLIDDIQTAINAVKASTKGSVTQAQFDTLIKAQLKKMGIL